ncbi:hypothetical protein [Dickeya chrysanthemi]|uniref:hypothetical protein n=1 Tax=Dickeya chrysanthemi TaxID=556 RepID=UPI001CF5EE59|nr:hypothetical protein [Dickeya chrysanthemi]MCA7008855.1 hypothetical protein [Dickeya chrysanthemi]
MPNHEQNTIAEQFKGMSMNAEDALINIAGLLNAGMFLLNTEHHSVDIELISISHDYACEVSKGGNDA